MQGRRLFVSGLVTAGLAGCAGTSSLLAVPSTSNSRLKALGVSSDLCGGGLGKSSNNCGGTDDPNAMPVTTRRSLQTSTFSGLGAALISNGRALPSIDSYGSFTHTYTSGNAAVISGYNQASHTLTSLPPQSGSFAHNGGTITVGPVNLVAQWVHPTYGTLTAWINQNAWTVCINHSQVPANTISFPLASRHTQSFWGIVGIVAGVIGLGIAIPALFTAFTAAAAIGGGVILTADIVTGLAGFFAGSVGLVAGALDAAGCNPFCSGSFGSYVPGAGPPLNHPAVM